MKILKYIFLLIVLATIALTVFIATQSSSYSITKSINIKLPKNIVYNYINDFKNFEQWQVFNQSNVSYQLDSLTKGKNAGLKWNANSIKNIAVYPNDSLVQQLIQDDSQTLLKWNLKGADKETRVTLTVSSKMDFVTKFKAFFQGGPEKIIGPFFEKYLKNLNYHLIEEYTKFEIKNEGIATIKETFYIKQIVSCNLNELGEKIFNTMKSMQDFCIENNLVINGDPFTIFENIDFNTGRINYAVCLPITTEIFTSDGSDITGGKIEAFYAYKTVLIGDYSHSDKAWVANKKAISENKLTPNENSRAISIYKKSILDTNKPSEWITEILTPVNESIIYIPEVTNDTINTIQ